MQTKDIPDKPILEFLLHGFESDANWPVAGWATFFSGFVNSVDQAFPPDTPPKLILSKMRSLQKRGLIGGCTCGIDCRGDLEITDKGREHLKAI